MSAVNQYFVDKNSNVKITYYYGFLKSSFPVLVLIALVFDNANGQIFPQYPHLSLWITFISVGLGYFYSAILAIKAGRLVQYIAGDDIFTLCPNCGYSNVHIEEICKNCGYQKGMHVNTSVETKNELSDQKNEIDKNINSGLYKKASAGIVKGLSLSEDETVLLIVTRPSMKLRTILRNGEQFIVNKFGNKCVLNGVVLSNKRICFFAKLSDGWQNKYCYTYSEIKALKTENKMFYSPFLDEVDKMTIETTDATYILRGTNPKKLYDAIAEYVRKYSLAVKNVK